MIRKVKIHALVLAAIVGGLCVSTAAPHASGTPTGVTLVRVPHGGIQPAVAVDQRGVMHLLYFAGDDDHAGNLFYVRSTDYGATFSTPVRVNSQDGSAIA